MITNFHAVDRQLAAHFRVDGFDDFLFQRAAANVRLVGGDDQQKSGGFQSGAGVRNFRKNFEIRSSLSAHTESRHAPKRG